MTRFAGLVLAALLLLPVAARAQDNMPPRAAPTQGIAVGALPVLDTTPAFDPAAATKAYLAKVGGAARDKSDAYFEGGYWLQLLDLVYALAVAGLLLGLRISIGIREWLSDRIRGRTSQTIAFTAIYMAITIAATLPLSIYEGYVREHAYGLSNQSFWQWAGDFGIGAAVTTVSMLIMVPLFYFVMRRARETWWVWGSGIAVLALIAQMALYPIAIAPLTNHYQPLPQSQTKEKILALAQGNGVPVNDVYVVDASRQSSRISANVQGFWGSTRISLNDNLLKQPADQVLAVLGHEIGHYALGHTTRLILLLGLVIALGFAFANWGFRVATDLFGGLWNVRRIDDIAGLPLLMALASVYFFAMTPVTNSIIRTVESQADLFGVNAVRKPDAFAEVALKLSSYRKLDPGRWEEIVFYDHPSGRARIAMMMQWKKAHIADADIRDTAKLP